jgi:hypothetical protein
MSLSSSRFRHGFGLVALAAAAGVAWACAGLPPRAAAVDLDSNFQ